jgi:hypothetical protein
LVETEIAGGASTSVGKYTTMVGGGRSVLVTVGDGVSVGVALGVGVAVGEGVSVGTGV